MTQKYKKWVRFLGAWHLAPVGLALLFFALLHRIQLGMPGYATSPLIDIQIYLVLLIIVVLFVYPFLMFFLFFQQKLECIRILVINAAIGMVAWVAAMVINAPTLVYMT